MKKSSLQKKLPLVTVVLPMRNASSTVIQALESIIHQDYPIKEIILVDNVSKDNSVSLVENFAKKRRRYKIRVLKNKEDRMVAGSFNRGVREATTPYVALIHSDCKYSSRKELSRLIKPMLDKPSIIATYGYIDTPLSLWNHFSFWEKCLLSQTAGRVVPGLVGKVDCYNRTELLKIGGFDDKGYKQIGGEDADLHYRLREQGKILKTKAQVVHMHYLFGDFSLLDLIRKKKAIARTYGKLLRIQGLKVGIKGIIAMLFKPFLAIGSFIPFLNFICIPLIIIFQFLYFYKMFTTASTLFDPKIFLLPFIGIFLVYYETFWEMEAFFQKVK